MFTKEFLEHDLNDLKLEIERRCIALQLDCSDEVQAQMFVHDLLRNIEQLKLKATHGDMLARIKVEIYGLFLLMYEANQDQFGSDYSSKIDEQSKLEST